MIKSEFMVILVITFLVIMAWLVFGIIHTRASIEVTPQLQDTLESINPNFDQATLDQVSKTPELNLSLLPAPSSSPTTPVPASALAPIPSPVSTATSSASPPAATSSATTP